MPVLSCVYRPCLICILIFQTSETQCPRTSVNAPSSWRQLWQWCLFYPTSTVHVWFVYWYFRPVKHSVQGPLLMHHPAEDNYGNDACSILHLSSMFDLYTDISDQWNSVSTMARTPVNAPSSWRQLWQYCLFYPASTVHVWFVYWYFRPVKLGVQGPLLMHPPAEDNYGNDACSILRLPSMFDLYTDISDQWS